METDNSEVENFSICITVIDAKNLPDPDMNPMIQLEVGSAVKYTSVRKSTDHPFFNEYFVFELQMPFDELLEQQISFTLINVTGFLQRNRVMGKISFDAATIWLQKGHAIHKKWIPFLDLDNVIGPAAGYVRVDLGIVSRGEPLIAQSVAEDDEVDGNLFIPDNVTKGRSRVVYSFKIYRAERLSRPPQVFMDNIKKVFGKNIDIPEIFVRIVFGDLEGKTSVKMYSDAIWNEEIVFFDVYPPFTQRVKIQIFYGGGVWAGFFVDLKSISSNEEEGYLPMFGPSYTQLYGYFNGALSNNIEGMFSDSAQYRGRLLWELSTALESVKSLNMVMTRTVVQKKISDLQNPPWEIEDMFLVAVIFSGTLHGRKLKKGNLMMEVAMGDEASTQKPNATTNVSLPFEGKTENNDDKSCNLCVVDFTGKYPCMFAKYTVPTVLRRLFQANVLTWMEKVLKWDIWRLQNESNLTDERVKQIFKEVSSRCDECVAHLHTLKEFDSLPSTTLDYQILRACYFELDAIMKAANEWSENFTMGLFDKAIGILKIFSSRLQVISENPQDMLPNIHIWLWHDKERYAFDRISARRILDSRFHVRRGDLSGRIRPYCFKEPSSPGKPKSTSYEATFEMFLWLGTRGMYTNMETLLPPGWQTNSLTDTSLAEEKTVVYGNFLKYDVLAFLYQGRILTGKDYTGLSDPLVRLSMWGKCTTSEVKSATLNPLWNEVLRLEKIELPGTSSDYYKDNPPCLLIELLDTDAEDVLDFIGSLGLLTNVITDDILGLNVQNNLNLLQELDFQREMMLMHDIIFLQDIPEENEEETEEDEFELMNVEAFAEHLRNLPELPMDWFPLFSYDNVHSGDILASFTMRQISSDDEENKRIDDVIGLLYSTPKLVLHRLEVYFWGLRNFKTSFFKKLNTPYVIVECAGYEIQSTNLPVQKKNGNFEDSPLQFVDVFIPANYRYLPAITVKIVDVRTFDRLQLVGCHVIRDINRYRRTLESRMVNIDGTEFVTYIFTPRKMSIRDPQRRSTLLLPPGVVREETKETSRERWKQFYNVVTTKHHLDRRSILTARKRRLSHSNTDSDDTEEDWWTKYYNGVKFRNSYDEWHLDLTEDEMFDSSDDLPRVMIYRSELEKQPCFSSFMDWLSAFQIKRGNWVETEESNSENTMGLLKCAISLYSLPGDDENTEDLRALKYPLNTEKSVVVRVYIIKANGLHPMDYGGRSDPYVVVQVGQHKISDHEHYVPDELNPVFGRCYEFEATFPRDFNLKVQLLDYDVATADDFIGETEIDLENRYYSLHRGTCGLSWRYDEYGFNVWRDSQSPSEILEDMCQKCQIQEPEYFADHLVVGSSVFNVEVDLAHRQRHYREVMALKALHSWHLVPEAGLQLVPEHVETRSLYNPQVPGIERGKIEMWVDILEPSAEMPRAVNITPRQAIPYELRVIVWNTEDVVLSEDDFFTGERVSDIYVKGWLTDVDENQTTDVHYRSLTGEGMFNWRFVFPFQYLSAERRIVVSRSNFFSSKITYQLIPCKLCLQIWDNDHFSADDFLGMLTIDLTRLPRGAKDPGLCELRILGREAPTINLFRIKRSRGWYPFHDIIASESVLVGKVDLEMEILTLDEALNKPAGLGRNEPEPLPAPDRPDTSFSFFRTPLRALRYLICKRYRCRCICFLLLTFLVLLFALAIYAAPGLFVKKIIGV